MFSDRSSDFLIRFLSACAAFWIIACAPRPAVTSSRPFDAAFIRLSPLEVAALPLAVRFDPPLGSEDGALTYNAQPFRTTRHLGDDLNGIGGWNSDFGDPVYAAGAGKVVYSGVPSEGWGKMLIIAHRVPKHAASNEYRLFQTVYAHMDRVLVKEGDLVKRAQSIATVGSAAGKYFAHLHFELRESGSVYPGAGYSDAALDRVSPESFIREHRGSTQEPGGQAP
jgi:hypothetical protein